MGGGEGRGEAAGPSTVHVTCLHMFSCGGSLPMGSVPARLLVVGLHWQAQHESQLAHLLAVLLLTMHQADQSLLLGGSKLPMPMLLRLLLRLLRLWLLLLCRQRGASGSSCKWR